MKEKLFTNSFSEISYLSIYLEGHLKGKDKKDKNEDITLFDYLKELGISVNRIKALFLTKKLKDIIKHKQLILVPIDLLNYPFVNPLYQHSEVIKILEEDDQWLALSKPFETHCYPLVYSEKNTILNFLRSQKVIKWPITLKNSSLLFRTDFHTTGLVLCAKNKEKFSLYREKYHELIQRKKYYALIFIDAFGPSNLKKQHKMIYSAFLTPFGEKGAMMNCFEFPIKESKKGSIVLSYCIYYKIEETKIALVEILLDEGHRHQIRAQLAFEKMPIVGDDLYGHKEKNNWWYQREDAAGRAHRYYLHCSEIHLRENSKAIKIFKDDSFFEYLNFLDPFKIRTL